MKKALAGVLAVALIGVIAGSAMAQVPNIQVYFDPAFTQTQAQCPGTPSSGDPVNLYVVMNNWNMTITGVDFTISYPASLVWVGEQLPDPLTQVAVGDSRTGIQIAYANCCPLDGFQPSLVLKPLVVWGVCDCANGPQALTVRGYGYGSPVAKPAPTAIRKEDFAEISGVGMISLVCPGAIATEPSTWGQVKALYR